MAIVFRALLLILLMQSLPIMAQKAGSDADSFQLAPEAISDIPTEDSIWGMPVNIHGQTTYINQRYNNFTSSYSGQNSLSELKSMSYTWSGTLFFWSPFSAKY
ncbi:hypothetical protein [Polynucleobacter necessarius]|uniref:hypothetical protein n=1 Tax=Polynucleobacter necessarius TaxID=576610 RepID=UPI001E5710A2|nr:hypothetical protein [Polynucleobacter necessarius]